MMMMMVILMTTKMMMMMLILMTPMMMMMMMMWTKMKLTMFNRVIVSQTRAWRDTFVFVFVFAFVFVFTFEFVFVFVFTFVFVFVLVQSSDSFSGPGVTHSARLLNVCQDLTMSAVTIFQFGFVQIFKCICKNLKMYLSRSSLNLSKIRLQNILMLCP